MCLCSCFRSVFFLITNIFTSALFFLRKVLCCWNRYEKKTGSTFSGFAHSLWKRMRYSNFSIFILDTYRCMKKLLLSTHPPDVYALQAKRKEKCQNLNPTAVGLLSHETDYSSSSGYAGIHCYTFVHLHRFIGVVALWLRTELCLHVLACILNERETCWNAHKFSNQSSNETLHRSNAIGSCAVAATLLHHSHNFARSRFKPTASNRNRSLCFSVLIYTMVL